MQLDFGGLPKQNKIKIIYFVFGVVKLGPISVVPLPVECIVAASLWLNLDRIWHIAELGGQL